MDWIEIFKWIALPSMGAIALAIVQHFLNSRSRKVNNTVKIGEAWEGLVEQLRAQVESFEERVQRLEDENETLARQVEKLTKENVELWMCIQSLKAENQELRG